MALKNKYILRSKISEAKFRQLVRLFCVDLTATQIAQVARLNRNTVNRLLQGIRERIALTCEAESPVSDEVEVDESYFGARRVRGLRGRKARGKTIDLGLFKKQGRVYRNRSRLFQSYVARGYPWTRRSESVIHSDGWRGYSGLVDLDHQKTLSRAAW